MSWTQQRARVASLSRSREPDDPDLLEARENLRTLRREHDLKALEDHVRKVVAEAPPLTAEQRDRIAAILRGSASGDAL